MALKQVTVTGDVTFSNGAEGTGGTIKAVLSRSDFDLDGTLVAPKEATGTVDAAGAFSIDLWPNTRGADSATSPSTWTITVTPETGGKAIPYSAIIVPDADVPVTLQTIINSQAAAKAARISTVTYLTQAELDAAMLLDPTYALGRVIVVLE